MIRRTLLFATLLSVLVPLHLRADPKLVVVELYTSQGCSSCPPADKLMHDLAARDDVIALALHVDYWDYIGWKDEYANPAYTSRQQKYAHVAGRKMVYTPQMIIGGQDDVVGARSMELADLIAKHSAQKATTRVRATREGNDLKVTAETDGPFSEASNIHLVRYDPERVANITRGENAGRTLTYTNVVADWQVVGQWDGTAPLEMTVPVSGDMPSVVLVQMPGPGRILAAARVE